ncbi:MAG: LexA family transcriptional regulator [Magnetococcales bacterium]|nr:LexA family transcriptional regulator [Magnetococcales bacterium]
MSFSDRVKSARKYANLTQKELADKVGISQTAIHKLECGRSRSSRRSVAIALACGVEPIWLETGRGRMRALSRAAEQEEGDSYSSGSSRGARAPLISWEDAALWNEQERGPDRKVEVWVPVTRKIGKTAFALSVSDDSMEPEFLEGDIIIVDPDAVPEHRKYVVVRLPGELKTTFKQIIMDGGRRYLKPLNTRYPITEINESAVIKGVVVSKYKEY